MYTTVTLSFMYLLFSETVNFKIEPKDQFCSALEWYPICDDALDWWRRVERKFKKSKWASLFIPYLVMRSLMLKMVSYELSGEDFERIWDCRFWDYLKVCPVPPLKDDMLKL